MPFPHQDHHRAKGHPAGPDCPGLLRESGLGRLPALKAGAGVPGGILQPGGIGDTDKQGTCGRVEPGPRLRQLSEKQAGGATVTAPHETLMPAGRAAAAEADTLHRSSRWWAGLAALVPESDRPQPDLSWHPTVPTAESCLGAWGSWNKFSQLLSPERLHAQGYLATDQRWTPGGLRVCGGQDPSILRLSEQPPAGSRPTVPRGSGLPVRWLRAACPLERVQG